ncbi:hypothetical protein B0T11DRAFT_288935 [Plectosphaerella cucumerina]|uniref:Mitochondrial division protein 1 n=1 Tax=Plectosphaerella cucumerina TaxID=40658 RepID=A0A8K0T5A3_9PEZI|nr:hypothetical protein B0T11DRAFT_288935 [Plectosphaerella cucumerina]
MAEAFAIAASALSVIEIAAKVLNLCGDYLLKVKSAKDDIRKLSAEVTLTSATAHQVKQLVDGPGDDALEATKELYSALEDAVQTLEELNQVLRDDHSTMRPFGRRALEWPYKSKAIEKTIANLAHHRELIALALSVDQTRYLLRNLSCNTVLEKLLVAEGAAFDSHAEEHNATCLPETRVDLLRDVSRWVDGQDSKAIFWLNGMAGTGKSTISRTVARSSSASGTLGATFFFKRGESNRSHLGRFIPTLAYQLAGRVPGIGALIQAAMKADSAIADKTIQEQFDKLIRGPLAAILARPTAPTRLVFVIDALDECERDDDIHLLIRVLSSATTLRSQLRFFVTSRPDLPIRLGFSRVQGAFQDLVLHDMPAEIVMHDLIVFFNSQFDTIRSNFNERVSDSRQLPTDWPGLTVISTLAERAKPLFIFAATLCRFVGDYRYGSPAGQLARVVAYSASHGSQLNQTYGPVLDAQFINVPNAERPLIIEQFVAVVGSIITLAEPLSPSSLSALLDLPRDTIDSRLDLLHSVLRIADDESPVRPLHLSFRDYLVDPSQKEVNPFWVDQSHAHRVLAESCLRVMRRHLRRNMAGLTFPGMRRDDIDEQHLKTILSPELIYACRFWAHHWDFYGQFDEECCDLVYAFLKEHLLHWLEALSLMGCARECSAALRPLRFWEKNKQSNMTAELPEFIVDALRFVRSSFSAIENTPLQVYSSALAFAPILMPVRTLFSDRIPPWLSLCPQVNFRWDACQAVLEGHTGPVSCVAFSRNSKLLASGARDGTIRIWETSTDDCKTVLYDGEINGVRSLDFSHDSKILAATSSSSILLWNIRTGQCTSRIEHNKLDYIRTIRLSLDSKMLLSGSDDGNVRLWDTRSGTCNVTLKGHQHRIESVRFSPNNKKLLSGSYDNTARLWDAASGNCLFVLEGHRARVNSVAFSRDATVLVTAACDSTIRCWDANTGDCQRVLKGQKSEITSAAFIFSSVKLLASASANGSMFLWDVDSGEPISNIQAHGDLIQAVAVASGHLVASCGDDGTIRVWNAVELLQQGSPSGHDRPVTSVAFAHNSRFLASSSEDTTVRIWSTKTGEPQAVLRGHGQAVLWTAFSRDSTRLVSTARDGTSRLWDTQSWTCVEEITMSAGMDVVLFSPDLTTMASTHFEDTETVRLWDVATGQHKAALQCGGCHWISAMAYSCDSSLFAVGGGDDTILIWDLEAESCLHVLEGHQEAVTSLVFSPSVARATLFASGSADTTIRTWDASTGVCHAVLEGHTDPITSLAFSSDSGRLASGSRDQTVRIWDTDAKSCLAIMQTSNVAYEMSFSPDDRDIITSHGCYSLPSFDKTAAALPMKLSSREKGIGFGGDSWITLDGKPWLWLPAKYRGGIQRVQGDRVAIGCRSGEVMILGIRSDLASA